jgi:hypothetical protein
MLLPFILIIILNSFNIFILITSLTLLFFIWSYIVIIPKGLIKLDRLAIVS